MFRNEPFSKRDAWAWMIDKARWKSEPEEVRAGNTVVMIGRGQLCYSERYLAEAWGWTKSKVHRFLKALRDCKKIELATEPGQNIITICKYEKNQFTDKKSNHQSNRERTGSEPNKKDGNNGNTYTSSLRSEGDGEENNSDVDLFGQVPSKWAFEGRFIKVQKKEFDDWLKIFHAVPDLQSELYSLDVWLQEPENKSKIGGWKRITVNSLQRKHNEHLQLQKQAQAKEDAAEEVGFREYDPNNPLPRPAPRTNRGRN